MPWGREVSHQRFSGHRLTSQTPVSHESGRLFSVIRDRNPSLRELIISFIPRRGDLWLQGLLDPESWRLSPDSVSSHPTAPLVPCVPPFLPGGFPLGRGGAAVGSPRVHSLLSCFHRKSSFPAALWLAYVTCLSLNQSPWSEWGSCSDWPNVGPVLLWYWTWGQPRPCHVAQEREGWTWKAPGRYPKSREGGSQWAETTSTEVFSQSSCLLTGMGALASSQLQEFAGGKPIWWMRKWRCREISSLP